MIHYYDHSRSFAVRGTRTYNDPWSSTAGWVHMTDERIIISASRRTDIPAFYSDWLITQLHRGFAEVTNPYSHAVNSVPLSAECVHSIVLWSKNFAPLLKRIDALTGYELFFMFTINDSRFLEPRVPPLSDRFEQCDLILKRFGKERLLIRFDPIVYWKEGTGIRNNCASFQTILKRVAGAGITRMKTSFMDTRYRKLARRGVDFIDLPVGQKIEIAATMGEIAGRYGITLEFCCNDYLFKDTSLPNIEKSCCIDGRYMACIVGRPTIFKKDPSQRKECQCTYSRDIGDYAQQCPHSCLYCYANPRIDGDHRERKQAGWPLERRRPDGTV
ncbi:MAG: DUF1848 family protein [bacterium]